MYENYVRERITRLRVRKGVSEYKMSYDLGHSRSYIYNISSGKSLPPMSDFFAICDYFELTPAEFFDNSLKETDLIKMAVDGLKELEEKDILVILSLINRLKENQAKKLVSTY